MDWNSDEAVVRAVSAFIAGSKALAVERARADRTHDKNEKLLQVNLDLATRAMVAEARAERAEAEAKRWKAHAAMLEQRLIAAGANVNRLPM